MENNEENKKELKQKEEKVEKVEKVETIKEKDTKSKNTEPKNEKVAEVTKVETKKEKAVATEKVQAKKETVNPKKNDETKSNNKKVDKKKTDKKSNNKKLDKKSNNKNMTPIIAIVAVIIVIVIGYLVSLNITKYSAIKEIKTVFDAMKAGDEQTIKNYLNETEDTEQENQETDKEITKIMLSKMDYEVISAKPSFNKCTIKLSISNKNLEKIFTNYMQKVFSIVFLQDFTEGTQEEVNTKMKDIFEQQYNSEDIETVSNEVTITMKKENGKWKMEAGDKEVINAILPGYESIMNSLN